MKKIKFEFDYWKQLDSFIKENYPNEVIFINDRATSFFDADEVVLDNPDVFSFKDVEEFIYFIESGEERIPIDIIDSLSVLWINGVRDFETIYKLRG